MGGRELILARGPAGDVLSGNSASWRFFAGRVGAREPWSERLEDAIPLFDEAASEMSVSYDPAIGRFVAVYSRFGLSPEILGRVAERPEGPWSRPVTLYRAPDVDRDQDYFSYAAKAHPELPIADGRLIVSYAVNSMDLGDHLRDLDLYWPRFIAVDLRGLLRAARPAPAAREASP
jgi:hypothetical protein